jgi:hypothetical protein
MSSRARVRGRLVPIRPSLGGTRGSDPGKRERLKSTHLAWTRHGHRMTHLGRTRTPSATLSIGPLTALNGSSWLSSSASGFAPFRPFGRRHLNGSVRWKAVDRCLQNAAAGLRQKLGNGMAAKAGAHCGVTIFSADDSKAASSPSSLLRGCCSSVFFQRPIVGGPRSGTC